MKRPALTREAILDAAIALLDRDGMDGLSMRRLGQALGVEAMSLYNHVPSKAALLDGIHERILLSIELPTDDVVTGGAPGRGRAGRASVGRASAGRASADHGSADHGAPAAGWQAYVRHQALALHRALLTHPHAIPLFATRPASTPAAIERLDRYLAVLLATGFNPFQALSIVQLVAQLVVGHAMWTAGVEVALIDESAPAPSPAPAHVRQVELALETWDSDRELALGLDAMLLGFEHVRTTTKPVKPAAPPAHAVTRPRRARLRRT